MNDWENAKRLLNTMTFPATEFKNTSTSKDESCVKRYPYTHKKGKKHSGRGVKTMITEIANIEGYCADAWELYCYECSKVYEMGMVIFNNEENVCYIRKFMEDKQKDSLETISGGLNI